VLVRMLGGARSGQVLGGEIAQERQMRAEKRETVSIRLVGRDGIEPPTPGFSVSDR